MLEDPRIINQINVQTQRIDSIVSQLDQRWSESEKVLNAIRKHYHIHSNQSSEMSSARDIHFHQEGRPGEGEYPAILNDEILATKELLNKNDDIYRNVFMNFPIGMAIVTPKFQFFSVNQTWVSMIGYPEKDLLTMFFPDITHPDSVVEDAESLKDLIAGTIPVYLARKQYIRKDGSLLWGRIRVAPMKDHQGSIRFFIIQIETILPDRLTQGDLQENEAKYRTIFNLIHDGIHIHKITSEGTPGKFIEVNEEACRMLQYTHEEMLTFGPLDFVTGYHSRPFNEIISELSLTGHSIFETEHQGKDMTIIPVEINAHVVSFQGKNAIVSVVRDISVRKQIEGALRSSETKYRQLIEYANEAIVVVQEGMLTFVNPRMTELTGYQERELLSMSFRMFIHQDDLGMVMDMHQRRLNGENISSRYSFRLIRKDQVIIWIEVSAVVIEWEGNPATLNFLMDITE